MVSSYVDLLETEYGDQLDDEAEEYMEFAVNGARRMKRMINSLLDYSRVHTEAGEFTETDVNEVFATTRRTSNCSSKTTTPTCPSRTCRRWWPTATNSGRCFRTC
ncbi:MAG: histidine kinase dimerization/phospho-acceptor domain-containing protein [Halobacteriaceae archaeon]